MSHTCHAIGCQKPVPPSMLMCKPHWFMVPADLRSDVWRTYVPGQEITKTPTRAYCAAARAAEIAVAKKEAASAARRPPPQLTLGGWNE